MSEIERLAFVERFRTEPVTGAALVAWVAFAWVAGAVYCSGYERLLSGVDNWPGSLWWSAAGVLPWLALFEWSKSSSGRRIARGMWWAAALLIRTAAGSLLLEYSVIAIGDGPQPSLGLAIMRRLPAMAAASMLILWSRTAPLEPTPTAAAPAKLESMAGSIDWIEAADNYVQLHIDRRVVLQRMTMRQAEATLAPHRFVRIHRRILVNRERIEAVAGPSFDQVVRLVDGTELPVGRTFAPNLERAAH